MKRVEGFLLLGVFLVCVPLWYRFLYVVDWWILVLVGFCTIVSLLTSDDGGYY
jgi:hypothetical protein